jgi:hypothetical protein
MTSSPVGSGEAPLRAALHRRVAPSVTAVFDELWVPQTDERADVATVGETFDGFELKSARDTLSRLPRQVGAYSRVFDRCTLVAAERHARAAWVPDWWGLIVVDRAGRLDAVRPAKPNPGPLDPETLVRLLWKDDVAAALARLGLITGQQLKVWSRATMWERLLAGVDLDTLRGCVRRALIDRARERPATIPRPDGGLFGSSSAPADVDSLAPGCRTTA